MYELINKLILNYQSVKPDSKFIKTDLTDMN
jgi:hypothetical protein